MAAGIPVIVPKGISNQYLIEQNGLGFAADSLEEAVAKVEGMTETQYREYIRRVGEFAKLLRNGFFTKKFLIDVVHAIQRRDRMDSKSN